MAMTLWRPMRSSSPFGWDLDQWFDDFSEMERDLSPRFHWHGGSYRPAMESYVKHNEVHLRAELPGVDPKEVDISLQDGHLCITGERKRDELAREACYDFEEMSYGPFSRCFHVPRGIDPKKIHAVYENGLLEITLPLEESAVSKKIPIEVAKGEIGESRSVDIENQTEESASLEIETPFNA